MAKIQVAILILAFSSIGMSSVLSGFLSSFEGRKLQTTTPVPILQPTLFERRMQTSYEKIDFTVSTIYKIFLNQDAPAAPSELYDLPDELVVPAPECGCEEGTVCDCDYALCDTVKPPTVYKARTLISTQRVLNHLEAIKTA